MKMVVKNPGLGASQMDRSISGIKFIIFCLNVILWICGSALFGLSIWMRLESGFQEWVEYLDMYEFYIGVYILIFISLIVMGIAFVGCAAALMDHVLALYVHAGLQMFCFVGGLVGAGLLLDFSTYDSAIQPIIRRSMTNLISNSQHEGAAVILRIIQESIGCCGADGPMDYLNLLKPLPSECRDTVTGNAFFHGCVDELTWFLEARSGWVAGLTLALCCLNVVLAVLSVILVRAFKKEEELATGAYKR